MGSKNKLKIISFFICCLFCILLFSCSKKQDILYIQTEQWIMKEFGDSTVIQSLSSIPTSQPDQKFWRVSVLVSNGKKWEGLINYTFTTKEFKKFEIPVSNPEGD